MTNAPMTLPKLGLDRGPALLSAHGTSIMTRLWSHNVEPENSLLS